MCQDWILEVLADLENYARQNDLPGVARKVEEAIAELRREKALKADPGLRPVASHQRRVN